MKEYTPEMAAEYRRCDETEVESFKHLADKVTEISSRMKDAEVMDLGCGTGRYFRYVNNAKSIIGIDPSEPMLAEAQNPAGGKTDHVHLMWNDAFRSPWEANEFDFIYSIGVLGEHISFNDFNCRLMWDWLKPGGTLFFTIEDKAAKPDKEHAMTKGELNRIMHDSFFNEYTIEHKAIDSPKWKGAHHLVEAVK